MEIGPQRRLRRILPKRGSIILPLDGALIDGPTGGLLHMEQLLTNEVVENIDSVLGYVGLLKRLPKIAADIPFIANLSGSTILNNPTNKVLLHDVDLAVKNAADAVCFQIHLSDENEQKMLSDVCSVVSQASRFGIPVLMTVYPRKIVDGEVYGYEDLLAADEDTYASLMAHCVRVAVELGADAIKTTYPGSQNAMEHVTAAAMGVPIVIAGGVPRDLCEASKRIKSLMAGGAWGVAFGRQVFDSENPLETVKRIRKEIDFSIKSNRNNG